MAIILILAALLPIIIIPAINVPRAKSALINQSIDNNENELGHLAATIKIYVMRFPEILLSMIESPPIKRISKFPSDKILSSNDIKQFELLNGIDQYFISEIKCKSAITKLRIINELGMEVVSVENINGICEVKTNTDKLIDQKDKNYFVETRKLKKDEIFVSSLNMNKDIDDSRAPQSSTIRFSSPIYSYENEFKGIIVINVDGNELLNLLTVKSGNLFLVDNHGAYLYNYFTIPNESNSLNPVNNFMVDYPEISDKFQDTSLKEVTHIDGINSRIINFIRISIINNPNTEWIIARVIPESELMNIPNRLRNSIIILVLVIIFIVIIISHVISRIITKRINILNYEAQQIADGKYYGLNEDQKNVKNRNNDDEFNAIHLSLMRISRNLETISNHAEKISKGDYAVEISQSASRDNIAVSFNKMAINLERKNNQLEEAIKKQTNLAAIAKDSEQSMMNILEDVQEAELKVKQALHYAENITDSLTAALFVINTDAIIEKVNPDACSLLGYSQSELIGLPLKKVFDGESELESIIKLKKEFLDTDEIGFIYVHKSGAIINANDWVIKKFALGPIDEIRSQNFKSVSGLVDSGIAEELETCMITGEHIETKKILSNSDAGAAKINLNVFPSFNSDSEIIGISSLFYDEDSSKPLDLSHYSNILESVNIGQMYESSNVELIDSIWASNDDVFRNHERILVSKTGSQTPVIMSGSMLREIVSDNQDNMDDNESNLLQSFSITSDESSLNNGKITGAVLVAKDITELKTAEIEQQELINQIHSQSKLATLGEMATGVAHELNQPLTYINTTLQLLQMDLSEDKIDKEKLSGEVEMSLSQVERVTEIISHLRMLGRDDQTRKTNIYLGEIIDNSLLLLQRKMLLRNIKFTSEIEEKLPEIYGNSTQIEQVVINLFQNSIDALEEKEDDKNIDVNISTENYKVVMIFSDTGNGISQQVIDRIFEPFFTTKEVGKGTGLGLSICNGIVENHGGELTCQSEIGVGTKFILKLPISGSSWQ